ncbi:MAG: decarboxylating 6-phosphogluconate dehydrogenase [Candidatus Omnitrophota bacterium]|nr:decarboxylating 6-phosphogluconate dehydrogenase [Candidatus Omnitrophota bacterium]MDZ4243298.1 decarboxylating 6-phosphogluconate dehydrogenase [Candidatus Omnitrophota bacterium]
MSKTSTCDIPTILVVLGATGDLIKKKIIPSIYHLYDNQRLPSRFCVIGMARRDIQEGDFQTQVRTDLEARLKDIKQEKADEVTRLFTYHQGKFGDLKAFERLKSKLEKIDQTWGVCSNKLFYLAVPPAHFEPIINNMVRVRLNIPCGGKIGWTRLLIEKPFGENTASARKLFGLLGKSFKEEQLYLIDHYLTKDIVQAIMYFRFSNNLFEKSWNNQSIERIDVRLLETLGVEERGAFYDPVGAFRDVGSNHLLQMLAAITMDPSPIPSTAHLRQRRAEIMESLKKWTLPDIRRQTYRAQYDGYRSIPHVAPQSTTETYFKIKTELTHPAWKGVGVTLESGKRCPAPKKEVVVTFKKPSLCVDCEAGKIMHNRVVFSIEPEERISICFWTKKPGFELKLEERTFDFFLHANEKKVQYVEEYAELIFNSLTGNQSTFVSTREVLAQWRCTDPLLSAWGKNLVPLNTYAPDSDEMIRAAAKIGERQSTASMAKNLAIVGLGKMGAGMARRMLDQGWRVVGYNRSPDATRELAKDGLIPAFSLKEMIDNLPGKKIVWLMVPAGKSVDEIISGKDGLVQYLKPGDLIIDGGNSYYKDTVARAKKLAKLGIGFLDCGTSGGPSGARTGACLMIGGKVKDFKSAEPLFHDFALPDGYQFFPGAGAGHFVKMVHNGIEYGMMQAIAEGFTILKKSGYKLDLTRVTEIYNHGSVIQSRLVGWLKDAFVMYGENLDPISGTVAHSGEGTWTVKTARELGVTAKVIEAALQFRHRSEKNPNYTGQLVSALRGQFGHHPVFKNKNPRRPDGRAQHRKA